MTSNPAPAAILWDMDGTLIDSEPIWDVAVADFAVRHGLVMDEALRESTLGNSLPDAMGKVYDAAGIAVGDRDTEADARWLVDHVGGLFHDGLPWRPGAREALEAVQDAGIAMVVVTNTVRELTEIALATIGRHRFTATVCGDEVPMGKPAPFPYLRAADLLGYAPHACLVVEDSPTGVASATAAGCPTLVVPSGVDVDEGPGRVFRDSLLDVGVDDLAAAWRDALALS
ncbi:HAD family hydrolase [Gordonia sp. (in: high G+C Gram-positive bacteria)]|uniref:HAD family hydrolase n=1 Tax=Gordonia sp. (in: high G+C Gram-positive bacteria) TaxID=84139 RepID=UPI0039E72358